MADAPVGVTPDQGTGISITFGTSGFVAKIVGMRRTGMRRGKVDTTHSETTPDDTGLAAAMTSKPSDLYDPGQLVLDLHFDPNNPPPINKPAETITITYPLKGSETDAAEKSCTGFLTEVDEDYAPIDDRTMRTTVTLQAATKWTDTPAQVP